MLDAQINYDDVCLIGEMIRHIWHFANAFVLPSRLKLESPAMYDPIQPKAGKESWLMSINQISAMAIRRVDSEYSTNLV